jgi:hypothetical protein
MELHELTKKVRGTCSVSRTVLEAVKAKLEESNLSELIVCENTFNEVLEVTNEEPTTASMFHFIRIYDNNKSVDIQTRKNK